MQPIIPMWLIYLSGIADNLKNTVASIGILTIVVSGACWLGILMYEEEWTKLCTRCVHYAIIGGVIFFLNTFIPSQKTIYTMMIGSQITPNNIELVGGTLKSTMDYMYDKTESLIKTVKGDK